MTEQLENGVIRESDENGWRFYQIEGKRYISVTQVLDSFVEDYLKKWFIKNSAKAIEKRKSETAAIGSKIHDDIKNGTDNRFNALAEKLGIVPIQREFVVWSKLGYAGQADQRSTIASVGNKVYILDNKTGSFGPKAGLQMAAYKMACNERGLNVDGIGVISVPRDPTKDAQFFDYSAHMEDCEYAFCCALDMFKTMYYKKLSNWEFQGIKSVLQYNWSFNKGAAA